MADYTLSADITADASGFSSGFERAQRALGDLQSKVQGVSKNIANAGQQVKGFGGQITSSITKPALAASGALAGITLGKGMSRLVGIDSARAKLKGLGHDAESIETIMGSALTSVKGTSYGLDAAATTAASAVAAGIQPGKELTKYLELTTDAAAIAGVEMSEMGTIFNQVQTAGTAYTDELNQLADRGIPIYQWLAEEAGISAGAVRKMASDGEISAEMFRNAIDKNIGGAAKTIGEDSFVAAVSNIWASIGRIGANFLDAGGKGQGFFSTLKPLLTELNDMLGTVEGKAAELGVKFGDAFNTFIEKIREVKKWFDELSPETQAFIAKAAGIGAAIAIGIGPAISILGNIITVVGTLSTAFGFLLTPIGMVVAAIGLIVGAFAIAYTQSETFRDGVNGVFESIRDTVSVFVEWAKGAFSGMFEGGLLDGIVQGFSSVFSFISELVTTFVGSFADGFSGAGGSVETLLNLFKLFNPVMGIVMSVLQEYGPQIMETFGQIAEQLSPLFSVLGEALGTVAAGVGGLVTTIIETLLPIIATLGAILIDNIVALIPVVMEVFNSLVPIIMTVVDVVLDLLNTFLPLAGLLIESLMPILKILLETFVTLVSAILPPVIAIIGALVDILKLVVAVIKPILTVVIMIVAGIIQVVTPLIQFIAWIITSIIEKITPIIEFVAAVVSAITGNFDPLNDFFMDVFNRVYDTVTGVFDGIYDKAYNIFHAIIGVVKFVVDTVGKYWFGLDDAFNNIFEGIGENLIAFIDVLKGYINNVTSGINSALGIINKIPGVSVSAIPQLQRGTENWTGGLARMNEGGRGELVSLPSGTQVIPHDVSMRYAREAGRQSQSVDVAVVGGGSGDYNARGMFEGATFYIRDEQDARTLSRELNDDIQRTIRGRGGGG